MSEEVEKAPVISYAKANRESKKGEDAACALLPSDGAPACFAIFDGHSGKTFANKCSELVCQRLMEKGPPFTAENIKNVLWAVDEEVGKKEIADGATAQILCIEQVGDKLKGTFAWCGDSSAVVCDTSAEPGSVFFATESHTAGPDHQGGGSWKSEKGRIEFYRAVRKKLDHNKEAPHDTLKDDTTMEQIKEACGKVDQQILDNLGKPVDDEEYDILFRAFRRGKIIAQTFPDGAKSRKKVYVRQRDKDHDANQVWVVATAEDRADPGYSDLQMTRSYVLLPSHTHPLAPPHTPLSLPRYLP
uniref:PPM-type phosphatase domain-containing protein n=1 Tax=Haptolina brevifila TaxID=156173 RepID=A0A7S2BFY9_9EUKA|mmetsp:Transcript_12544/g.25209  ORF Transcript_12544/g.25209 Transcript_12544/m.25209 type:complete len:302 (+) Transcript_12544:47-952(+)